MCYRMSWYLFWAVGERGSQDVQNISVCSTSATYMPGLEFVFLFVCLFVFMLFICLFSYWKCQTLWCTQWGWFIVLGSLLCCGKWYMDQVNLLTWCLSLCLVSCFFSPLGRRNASRIFQMQLCVFGKGNQVLLRIMISRLRYSYSGMIGNKMFFFSVL